MSNGLSLIARCARSIAISELPIQARTNALLLSATTFELLTRANRGDRLALDALFIRHAPRLRRWASGRLPVWARDMTDTDDLVQDALLQTFKKLEGFDVRGTGALYAYLRQAVLNRVKDELRRKSRRPQAVTLDNLAVDDGPSPLERAIGSEALE